MGSLNLANAETQRRSGTQRRSERRSPHAAGGEPPAFPPLRASASLGLCADLCHIRPLRCAVQPRRAARAGGWVEVSWGIIGHGQTRADTVKRCRWECSLGAKDEMRRLPRRAVQPRIDPRRRGDAGGRSDGCHGRNTDDDRRSVSLARSFMGRYLSGWHPCSIVALPAPAAGVTCCLRALRRATRGGDRPRASAPALALRP